MTSKEALNNFMKTLCEYEKDTNNKESVYPYWHRMIREDLERLEMLEKVINILKDKFEITFDDYLEYASDEDLEENPNAYLMIIETKDENCNEFNESTMTSLNENESNIMRKMFND